MDSAADSLLALSTTAVALAEAEQPPDDDTRSSSLSELEVDLEEDDIDEIGDEAEQDADADADAEGEDDDDLEDPDEEEEDEDEIDDTPNRQGAGEVDSEAETERLEDSPEKLNRRKSFIATPSKLAQPIQMNHSPNERPEIESLTDSAISSPISSNEDSDDELSDPLVENDDEEVLPTIQIGGVSPSKRRREEDEDHSIDAQERSRKRRTLSDVNAKLATDPTLDQDEPPSRESKDGSEEPAAEVAEAEAGAAQSDEGDAGVEDTDTGSAKAKVKKPSPPSRVSSRRKAKDDPQPDTEMEVEEEVDEESEEAEADDAEVAAKSEEEQAKRMAAMEGLGTLERHFANLRDRLYDERIAAINHELAQLSESTPTHSELIKQVEAVRKYRDDKFDYEQKLLVYKVGALKTKSVAERAQIHSAYFQEVRDVRERHLERLSEHFYRIQRERFKTETTTPNYSVPFATRRSKQIIQQTAYNKEVSILSGVAKYVGFPAAPELGQTGQKDLEEDMHKMGVSTLQHRQESTLTAWQISSQVQVPRAVQRVTSTFSNISAPAVEEQSFLDKNPWANAQHPMHRLGPSRQNSNRSPMNDTTYLTPANQSRQALGMVGSASTIAEFPSSSQINTPHDGSVVKPEHQANATYAINGRNDSASPLDTRRNAPAVPEPAGRGDLAQENNSSPLTARINSVTTAPQRSYMTLADSVAANRTTASPTLQTRTVGITTGPGFGSRF